MDSQYRHITLDLVEEWNDRSRDQTGWERTGPQKTSHPGIVFHQDEQGSVCSKLLEETCQRIEALDVGLHCLKFTWHHAM